MASEPLVARLVRAGFEHELAEIYVQALRAEGASLTDADAEVLRESGLAEQVDDRTRLFPPDSALAMKASRLEGTARMLRDLGQQLQSIHRLDAAGSNSAVELIHSVSGSRQAFREVHESARRTVRALERGPYRSPATAPAPSQMQAMAAGVAYEVIYAADVWEDPRVRANAQIAMNAGESARVLSSVPIKMVLADDTLAFVTRVLSPDSVHSFVVYPSLVLDMLHGLFDTLWDLAIAINPNPKAQQELELETRRILECLASGLTDDAIANELGISKRTVARRITRLQEITASRSRFQLGMQAARRGLL